MFVLMIRKEAVEGLRVECCGMVPCTLPPGTYEMASSPENDRQWRLTAEDSMCTVYLVTHENLYMAGFEL